MTELEGRHTESVTAMSFSLRTQKTDIKCYLPGFVVEVTIMGVVIPFVGGKVAYTMHHCLWTT